jgi:hypothetical protein
LRTFLNRTFAILLQKPTTMSATTLKDPIARPFQHSAHCITYRYTREGSSKSLGEAPVYMFRQKDGQKRGTEMCSGGPHISRKPQSGSGRHVRLIEAEPKHIVLWHCDQQLVVAITHRHGLAQITQVPRTMRRRTCGRTAESKPRPAGGS